MADNPPPYEETYSGETSGRKVEDKKAANRSCTLRDQATTSRWMLVSVVAERIQIELERRALYGISRTTLVVVPSGQECTNLSGSYKIADFSEKPLVMELTGELNSVEFWSQAQALEELRQQVVSSIGDGRGSMLEVRPDRIHVRHETSFGLFDTVDVMAIVVQTR